MFLNHRMDDSSWAMVEISTLFSNDARTDISVEQDRRTSFEDNTFLCIVEIENGAMVRGKDS